VSQDPATARLNSPDRSSAATRVELVDRYGYWRVITLTGCRPRVSAGSVDAMALWNARRVDAAIEASGLTKAYGATVAVNRLDLRVQRGQVFGFLGPNGAGKSTTIRMLLGLHRPSAGSARVLGLDSVRESVAIHARCGYLPGDLELYPRMTGRSVLDWFAAARDGVDSALRDALVERFDVTLDRRIRELSKGNRQKIGLVIAFMHRPDLVVLDEPTTGLDPLMQQEFHHLLAETTAEGRTVFLSSHELDEVQRVADRVAIIKRGQLVVTDTVEALRRKAPQTIELRFRAPVPATVFDGLDDVAHITVDGDRVTMQVTGELAPLLRVIADHNPVELVTRRADLDELFLSYYRDSPNSDAT
jgi:ABC-2 type transport system ATP-binding protein